MRRVEVELERVAALDVELGDGDGVRAQVEVAEDPVAEPWV